MSEEYGSDYVTIIDDDGNEFELEFLDSLVLDDKTYAAFLPADMDEDDPDYGIIILSVSEQDGEEYYASIDDDAELDRVYERFMEVLFSEEDAAEDEAEDKAGDEG